jgi:hypothetical protein
MLVAPLAIPVSNTTRDGHAPARSRHRRTIPAKPAAPGTTATAAPLFLLAWFVAGLLVLLCVPAARGNSLLGATLPFWLVAAPVLDLAWLWRMRLVRARARARETLSGRTGTIGCFR